VKMLLHLGRISTRTELGIMLMVIPTSLLHGLGLTLVEEIFTQPETWKDCGATQPRSALQSLVHNLELCSELVFKGTVYRTKKKTENGLNWTD
jgi:hypothetical protein